MTGNPDTLAELSTDYRKSIPSDLREHHDFDWYLDQLYDEPTIARNAHQRVADMFDFYGTEYDEDAGLVEYKLASEDPINDGENTFYGQVIHESIHEFVNKVKSGARGLGPQKRIKLLLGPVGSGKTALIAEIVPRLQATGLAVGVVATDVTNSEDATALREHLDGVVPPSRVVGAVGDSASETLNSDRLQSFLANNPELDIVIVESSGDTTSATAPKAIDYSIFVISVAEGDDIPRKRGPGVVDCDLLVVNKTDLAPHVGADIDVMEREAEEVREGPTVFTNCKAGEGVDAVLDHVREGVLFA